MDWIKSDDESFDTQIDALFNWLSIPANAARSGLSSTEIQEFFNTRTNWKATYGAKKAHDAAGLPITAGKNTSRMMVEGTMRPIGKMLQAKLQMGTLTAAEVLTAGATPASTTRTASVTPTTRPVLAISPDQRLEHKVTWTDETTPASRAKPAGVKDLELRVAVVAQGQPAPADPDAYDYYRVNDPASPNLVTYEPTEAGKLAWMIGCWTSTRSERGPWSAAVSETIRA